MNRAMGYFKNRFKSTGIRLPAMCLLAMLVTFSAYNGGVTEYIVRYQRYLDGKMMHEPVFGMHGTWMWLIATAFCFIIALMELSAFNDRRFLDTVRSSPLSNTALVLSHVGNGIVQYTLVYFCICASMLAAHIPVMKMIHVGSLIEYFIVTYIIALALYCFFSLTFTFGNTVFDGAAISLVWSFTPFLIEGAVYNTLHNAYGIKCDNSFHLKFLPYNYLAMADDKYNALYTREAAYAFSPYPFAVLGISLAVMAVCLCFAVLRIKTRRTERAGETSDFILGYKALIPAVVLSAGVAVELQDEPIVVTLLVVAEVIGFVMYKRGFKFKPKELIAIVIIAALIVLEGFLLPT